MVKIFFKKYCLVIVAFILMCTLCVRAVNFRENQIHDSKLICLGKVFICQQKDLYPDELCPDAEDCINDKLYASDATTTFYSLLVLDGFNGIFSMDIFTPLLIIIITTYWAHQNLNSGNFKNELMRMSYSDFLKKNYKRVLKIALFIPLVLVLLYVMSYTISTGVKMSDELLNNTTNLFSIPYQFRDNIPLFLFTLVVNIYLNSIFYSNLALLTMKKFKNPVISVICAFLLFNVVAFLFEVVVTDIIWRISGVSLYNILSPLNFYAYDGIDYLITSHLFALFLAFGSTFINYLAYRNKESVIIESEK